jgi:hypothetical protein
MTDLYLSREHDPAWLRRAVADGALRRIRRGAYQVPATTSTATEPRRLARDRISAVHHQLRADHVFSHASAALLWGAPLWEPPARTHVLVRSGASTRSAPDIARHRGLPDGRVDLAGLPVTTLARTVVDCATTLHPLGGLVVADWALRHGLVLDDARRILAARRRRNGTARGRLILDLADRGAETPWETWLRYTALRLGLPRPRTQFPVRTPEGTYFVDLAWPEHHVLAEFDGRVKYVDGALGPGHDAETELFDEKLREDAITRRTGVRPLRFVARHARRPGFVREHLLRVFPPDVRRAARVHPLLPPPP